MKIFKVRVEEVDKATGEEREVLNSEYSGLTILADSVDKDSMHEVIFHDNIMNMAMKIAASEKMSVASKLANVVIDMKNGDSEKVLADMIGGMMDGADS